MNKPLDKNEMDFEITFYEGLLEKKPAFVEALAALGDLYTKRGDYEKGLKIDLKLAHLKPHDPIILYNLACSYSLLNRIDAAFETIQKAVDCGYDNFPFLEKDKDLHNLREDNRFQQFMASIRGKPFKGEAKA